MGGEIVGKKILGSEKNREEPKQRARAQVELGHLARAGMKWRDTPKARQNFPELHNATGGATLPQTEMQQKIPG